MSVNIGHASIDERGKIAGGVAGDQTGKEVCIRKWYSSTWHTVLRCKDPIKAEIMARACEAACNNSHIGYDQSQRNTLRTQAALVGWDLSKISAYCECDCSSLMAVCAECAGIAIPYVSGLNAPTTGNMVAAFLKTGMFDALTGAQYVGSDKLLRRGDILVKSGHTAMVLGNGTGTSTQPAPSYDYVIGKTYTLDANMYVRDNPDGTKVKYDALTQNAKEHAYFDEYGCSILRKGTRVTCKAVKRLDTSIWLQIPSGWVCAKSKDKVYII